MSAQPDTRRQARRWPPLETDESLRVYSRPDIVFILKKIMGRAAVVAAHFSAGQESVLTTILGVSEATKAVFLEPGPDQSANQHLLRAKAVLFSTYEGQVKIKFTADHVDEAEYMGTPALRIALPAFIIRLQRREFFRIPTSVVHPVLCCFRLDDGREKTAVLSDISVGGVCLVDNQQALDFKVGTVYDNCHIDLPGHGTVEMGLEIRNVADTKKVVHGKVTRRAGCKFLNLSRNAESIVQRYIMSVEMAQDMRSGRRVLVKR